MLLELGLGVIALGILTLGFLYAYAITKAPIERTWVEVLIGVAVTLAGEMAARALIYHVYGLMGLLWWTIPLPFICFVLTGGPMILFQEYKISTQKSKGMEIENQYNGEDH